MATKELAVGLDIGGTKIEGSLIAEDGKILKTQRHLSPHHPEAMINILLQMIHYLSADVNISGVGFAIPGSLHPHSGLLRNAPNSPAINGTYLARELRQRLTYPLAFENDANCLAISEWTFGAARNYAHVVGIIMGTGIGGGVISHNQLLVGANGLAPEPGHMPIDIFGRKCLCGNTGCAEAYLSGPSILKRYRELGGPCCTTQEIFEAVDDPDAIKIIEETRIIYVRFISSLISAYDPEVIVLGGGLSNQPIFTQQHDHIQEVLFGSAIVPKIIQAQHGETSGKLGAAALIFNHINVDAPNTY